MKSLVDLVTDGHQRIKRRTLLVLLSATSALGICFAIVTVNTLDSVNTSYISELLRSSEYDQGLLLSHSSLSKFLKALNEYSLVTTSLVLAKGEKGLGQGAPPQLNIWPKSSF